MGGATVWAADRTGGPIYCLGSGGDRLPFLSRFIEPSELQSSMEAARRWLAERWVALVVERTLLRQALEEGYEGAVRVLSSVRLPTRRELTDYLGRQALVNCLAWIAGLAAAGVVTSFVEVRGLRNLWGLLSSGDRTLVTAEDYRLIMSLVSFCAGMSMMFFVRRVLFRWIAEVRTVRKERKALRPRVFDPCGAPDSTARHASEQSGRL